MQTVETPANYTVETPIVQTVETPADHTVDTPVVHVSVIGSQSFDMTLSFLDILQALNMNGNDSVILYDENGQQQSNMISGTRESDDDMINPLLMEDSVQNNLGNDSIVCDEGKVVYDTITDELFVPDSLDQHKVVHDTVDHDKLDRGTVEHDTITPVLLKETDDHSNDIQVTVPNSRKCRRADP